MMMMMMLSMLLLMLLLILVIWLMAHLHTVIVVHMGDVAESGIS